jgi:hypothetical protein
MRNLILSLKKEPVLLFELAAELGSAIVGLSTKRSYILPLPGFESS